MILQVGKSSNFFLLCRAKAGDKRRSMVPYLGLNGCKFVWLSRRYFTIFTVFFVVVVVAPSPLFFLPKFSQKSHSQFLFQRHHRFLVAELQWSFNLCNVLRGGRAFSFGGDSQGWVGTLQGTVGSYPTKRESQKNIGSKVPARRDMLVTRRVV